MKRKKKYNPRLLLLTTPLMGMQHLFAGSVVAALIVVQWQQQDESDWFVLATVALVVLRACLDDDGTAGSRIYSWPRAGLPSTRFVLHHYIHS